MKKVNLNHFSIERILRFVYVAVLKAFFPLLVGFCNLTVSAETEYKSFAEFKEHAVHEEKTYLDVTFCVIAQKNGYFLADIANPDERILLTNATGLQIGKVYHGIYGQVSKSSGYFYINRNKYSGTEYESFLEVVDIPPVYIFPREITSEEVTYEHLNEYITVTGIFRKSGENKSLTLDTGDVIYLESSSTPTNNSRVTVNGLIGAVSYWVNSTSTEIAGIQAIEIWKEGEEPARTIKVSIEADETQRGNVIVENGEENVGREVLIKDGETAVLKASANSGYEFKEWTLNGQTFTTDSEFEWKVIGNATFEAHFLKVDTPKYVISVECSDDLLGSAEVITSMPVEQGEKVSIKAVAKNGAKFVKWTNETGELVSESAETDVYATDNLKYIAHFVLIGPINIITEGEGTVIVSQNGVEVTGNVDDGSNVDIEAVPNNGWKLTKISSGNTTYDSSPVEMTVRHPMEIHVIFEELPTPGPEPLPESVTTVADLRKYATAGAEMRITSPMTVVTHLINGGSEFLATDGSNVVICKAVVHPDVGSVITNSSGTFVDYGSGVLYFQINTYEEGVPEDYTKIDPIDSSVADVLSKRGEYVTISNARLGPTKDEQSNNRSYLLVYGKINSNSEPPVKAYCYFDEIGPESLIDNRYYTVTGVVGDCTGEKMLLITETPTLQNGIEAPRISLIASPANGGKVWIEMDGEDKGSSCQIPTSTQIVVHAKAVDGMEFAGWISTGTYTNPEGTADKSIAVTSSASYTALFKPKITIPTSPEPTEPENPDPTTPDNTENPTVKTYKVTFTKTDHGALSITEQDDAITSGTMVKEGTILTITALPEENYHLAELKINGVSRATDVNGMCKVAVSATTVIEAVFVRTIASSRQLRVAVEDWIEGVEMGKVYIDTPGTYYLESQMLVNHTFYAEPASDCKFIGWRVPGTDAPFNVSPVFTYNVRDGLTLIAEFAYIIPAPRIVEVRVSASEKGTATIKEFESTKATTRRYVTLTATPSAPRHMFRDWTDEDGNVVSTEPEFIYSSAAPALLTANFTSNYTLTLATDGPGNLEWYAENTDDATSIAENTRIRITATPEQHYQLASISINDADMTEKYFESDAGLTIVMNGDKNITARFTPMAYPVRVGIHAHGRIEVVRGVNADGTPGDGKIVDGYFAHYGDVLHIHPIPDDGYQLKEIRVNDIVAEHDLKKGYATHTVDGPASITVDFEAIPSGIEAAERDKESDPYLYDLQGRPTGRRSTARAGLYLMQSPKGWTKILISR